MTEVVMLALKCLISFSMEFLANLTGSLSWPYIVTQPELYHLSLVMRVKYLSQHNELF